MPQTIIYKKHYFHHFKCQYLYLNIGIRGTYLLYFIICYIYNLARMWLPLLLVAKTTWHHAYIYKMRFSCLMMFEKNCTTTIIHMQLRHSVLWHFRGVLIESEAKERRPALRLRCLFFLGPVSRRFSSHRPPLSWLDQCMWGLILIEAKPPPWPLNESLFLQNRFVQLNFRPLILK